MVIVFVDYFVFCSLSHFATFVNIAFEVTSITGTMIFSLVSIVVWYLGIGA